MAGIGLTGNLKTGSPYNKRHHYFNENKFLKIDV